MNKFELIAEIAKEAGMTKIDTEKFLQAFFNKVTETLARGEKIKIVGFGNFEVSKRAARKGRNPQTGEEIMLPATNVPKFRPSKALKDAVKA